MPPIPIRHALVLSSLLALAAGAQAQEAGAWETKGPPRATSGLSREQVASTVMWARAAGWRPAAEASRFDDDSPRLRRTARASPARVVALSERRPVRRARLHAPAGATQAGRQPEDVARLEYAAVSGGDASRVDTGFAHGPLAPQGAAATAVMTSGTESARVSMDSVDAGREAPGQDPGNAPVDLPQSPLAPGRETAIASPVRLGFDPRSDRHRPPDEPADGSGEMARGVATTTPVLPPPALQTSELPALPR